MGEDEEASEDGSPGPTSLIEKLKAKFSGTKKASGKEELSDEKAKKKKLFQTIIIALVVFYIASELLIPSEEDAVPEVDPKSLLKARKRPEKKQVPEAPKPAETDEGKVAEPSPEVEAVKDAEASVPDEVSATGTSEIDLTEGEPDTEKAPPVEVPVVTEGEPATAPTENTETAKANDQNPDKAVKPSETGSVSDMTDSVDGKTEEEKPTSDNITDQILQDLEKQAKDTPAVAEKKDYVAPPDYEYRGRGLVYNCLGKHWACVDAPSFKSCEDNASSVKYLQRPTECHPFNVYETVRGCEDMQNRMVSSSAKTDFCQE